MEAREWLYKTNGIIGTGQTHDESVAMVNCLYSYGASLVEVRASDADTTAENIIITLPEDPIARTKFIVKVWGDDITPTGVIDLSEDAKRLGIWFE